MHPLKTCKVTDTRDWLRVLELGVTDEKLAAGYTAQLEAIETAASKVISLFERYQLGTAIY